MTRSRFVLFGALIVVVVGVVAGLGALWMSPARAAVGPLVGEALILPSDASFVMGFGVKRFAASPFYERFATKGGLKPRALRAAISSTRRSAARSMRRSRLPMRCGGRRTERSTCSRRAARP